MWVKVPRWGGREKGREGGSERERERGKGRKKKGRGREKGRERVGRKVGGYLDLFFLPGTATPSGGVGVGERDFQSLSQRGRDGGREGDR